MRFRRAWRPLALGALVLGLGSGCADSIVRELAPENDPEVVNTPEQFQFRATDLRNVNERVTWVWPNPAPQATLSHDSFIHHGYGILIITDAAGVQVDSTLLELDLVTETRVGVPGDWTLTLILASARGRAHFSLTPEP